jgi:hypothetical protein
LRAALSIALLEFGRAGGFVAAMINVGCLDGIRIDCHHFRIAAARDRYRQNFSCLRAKSFVIDETRRKDRTMGDIVLPNERPKNGDRTLSSDFDYCLEFEWHCQEFQERDKTS